MKNPRVAKTNKGKILMLLLICAFIIKKSRFIKEPEASGLLSNLGLKTPLSKIPALAKILF